MHIYNVVDFLGISAVGQVSGDNWRRPMLLVIESHQAQDNQIPSEAK